MQDNATSDLKYITKRGRVFWYVRRIPTALQNQIGSVYHRVSLKTDDLFFAQKRRDMIAKADDDYWSELISDSPNKQTEAHYKRVLLRATHLNIDYKEASELLSNADMDQLLDRVALLEERNGFKSKINVDAVYGTADKPEHKITDMLRLYTDQIMATYAEQKNDAQKKRWLNEQHRVVNRLLDLVGDIEVSKLNRDHGLKFQDYFRDRVLKHEISPNTANRDLEMMQTMYKRYHAHFALDGKNNPFSNLKFSKGRVEKRPLLSKEDIKRLLSPKHGIMGLNLEARLIVLAMVETGMRLVEICNIIPENIYIDEGGVSYVEIKPRERYSLKTESSERIIPLVGIAKPIFQTIKKQGLQRYFGKADLLSGTALKFLRANNLLPTEKHTIYSLRHSFKERMVEAQINAEIIDQLMGHSNEKPKYGDLGSIKFKAGLLEGIAFEFSWGVVSRLDRC